MTQTVLLVRLLLLLLLCCGGRWKEPPTHPPRWRIGFVGGGEERGPVERVNVRLSPPSPPSLSLIISRVEYPQGEVCTVAYCTVVVYRTDYYYSTMAGGPPVDIAQGDQRPFLPTPNPFSLIGQKS